MERRDFFRTAGAAGIGAGMLGTLPGSSSWLVDTDETSAERADPSASLVEHCQRILEQNLLTEGETFVVATPQIYDHEYYHALMIAAGEIGATGMHVVLLSHPYDPRDEFGEGRMAAPPGYALTEVHWDLFARADLLITSDLGKTPELPRPVTSYDVTVGDHDYRSDMEYINRPGSDTRWLSLGYPIYMQRQYFPTEQVRERALEGAKLMDRTRGELRVTSDAGTDWRCSMEGRPGHAQYGIADMPGRWDNFAYGCAACGPVEDSAEGVLVLRPEDIVIDMFPYVLDEEIRLTFEGGYVTSIEGGKLAGRFRRLIESFDHPEAYGTSHFGWGVHERSHIDYRNFEESLYHYHHNGSGTLLFALGQNFGHGLGGEEVGYSGLGLTQRKAPNHTHFTMQGCNLFVAGEQVIEDGRLLLV